MRMRVLAFFSSYSDLLYFDSGFSVQASLGRSVICREAECGRLYK